ncbi:EscU/YscU/HrcU family type III secretion system export apparatus switch protein [Bradyrhizobium sp. LHD-71]|uniref:EscU/YscU/HrcU family type III secretion system export apparatus switch protein n=1 Tax=Bradyrhizobium sp. LHD-71 TaxID=3072141 RepID=UPI00280E9325|nr:EscU/YscU/HrcU family type III secretion system export apparatus switch protein [Bradyrhizobium sp. LHD-71]MDQ8726877.1 EscU/YscU/HrcU family type III secretion system export apparatus switch protein [Bradyrhizobium sp. LHD-71]
MSDTSEQKSLPASAKKLRDAREKGQIAHSHDFVSAVGAVAAITYLWSFAPNIIGLWREALLLAADLQNEPFQVALPQLGAALIALCWRTVLPLLAIAVAAGTLANLVMNRGFLFSLEPMIPSLEHINPFTGFKRIFGLKNWVELAKTIIKGLLLGSTLVIVVAGTLSTLVRLPICGESCIGFVFGSMAKLLLAIGIGFFLATGLIDILLQRWLFLREMRMTVTESKREVQDQEGNPQVRGSRRRQREEQAREPPIGARNATLFIRGEDVVIGLRYVRGETSVPIVVHRVRGTAVQSLLDIAASAQIPVVAEAALARSLRRKPRLGSAIASQQFERVARAMLAAGLV